MSLTSFQTIALAAIIVYLGRYIKRLVPVLDKYNLPSPVIGGFLFAIVFSLLKATDVFHFQFDKSFEKALMILFFTSVGYSASFRLLKIGGKTVIFFLLLTIGGLLLQVAAGMLAAKGMGLHPLLGVLTGPVALTGGPGTALAFGPNFEAAGIENATLIGLTTAMGGIIIGGIIGGPIATFLIHRKKLHAALQSKTDENKISGKHEDHDKPLLAVPGKDLINHILAFSLIMGVGTTLSTWFESLGITLPIYIGSMIIAAIVRNIEDVKPIFKIQASWIEEIGSVALMLFIAMAIMTLQLDELKNAALPIFVFLAIQTFFVALVAIGPAFWVAGKDYEAAVMGAGYIGFMMGTTANAMANMTALREKYGLAPKAFLVIPLVGSCFIDFFNAAIVTFILNLY